MSSFVQGRFDILPPPHLVLRFPVVKDAFTNSSVPTLNYGDTHDLLTGERYESFLGFDLSELPEEEFVYAKLVINVAGTPRGGEAELHLIESDEWTETGITHANRPLETTHLTTFQLDKQVIEIDVIDHLHSGYVLKSLETQRFWGRESGNAAYIEVAYINLEAFREVAGAYFDIGFGAQASAVHTFSINWESTLPYGLTTLPINFRLSNHLLIEYMAEPTFTIGYTAQTPVESEFNLTFGAQGRNFNELALGYTAKAEGECTFPLEFAGTLFNDWAIAWDGIPTSDLKLNFGIQDEGEHLFNVGYTVAHYKDLQLGYTAQDDGETIFAINFGIQAERESGLEINYTALSVNDLTLNFSARARGMSTIPIQLAKQATDKNFFNISYSAMPNTSLPILFGARAQADNLFAIDFISQKPNKADFTIEFAAMPAKDLRIDFAAQGIEQIELTLKFEALQRFISDLSTTFIIQTRLEQDFNMYFESTPASKFMVTYISQGVRDTSLTIRFQVVDPDKKETTLRIIYEKGELALYDKAVTYAGISIAGVSDPYVFVQKMISKKHQK